MVAWYKDRGLAVLDRQMRDKYPGIVIYGIGDLAHQNRPSDHNPEDDGSVDASDYMIGKAFTKTDAEWFFNWLIRVKDPRVAYVIWNRKIVSASGGWLIRKYEGDSPHTDHVHLSVNDKHENDTREWKLAEQMRSNDIELMGLKLPTLRFGDDDNKYGGYNQVWRIQRIVGVKADGVYGEQTKEAVKEFTGSNGEVIGLKEWKALLGLSAG